MLSRYPVAREQLPDSTADAGRYRVGFARDRKTLEEILRLRYQVFNLELDEGLAASHATGWDKDELDHRFHHLMITDREDRKVVGTYRLQTAEMASARGGFYTAGEFELAGFPPEFLPPSVH